MASLRRSGHRSFSVERGSGLVGGEVKLLEGGAVAALAVVEPLGDPGDRRGAGAGPTRDLDVVHPLVEEADDRPALRHVVEFAEGAEVAEEGLGLVGRSSRTMASSRS